MTRPECFESDEQWEQWRKLASLSKLPRDKFCVDCLPHFRDEMVSLGRCVRPETVFVIDKGKSIIGVSADEKGWFGAVTGNFEGSGKRSRRDVVAMASPAAIIEELRRRKRA